MFSFGFPQREFCNWEATKKVLRARLGFRKDASLDSGFSAGQSVAACLPTHWESAGKNGPSTATDRPPTPHQLPQRPPLNRGVNGR